MKNYSVREVVEQAVQTEKLGYDFYQRMTKKFENDGKLKELFDSLATKEKHHEKVFTDLLAKIKDQDIDNPEEFSAYLRSIVESEFFRLAPSIRVGAHGADGATVHSTPARHSEAAILRNRHRVFRWDERAAENQTLSACAGRVARL